MPRRDVDDVGFAGTRPRMRDAVTELTRAGYADAVLWTLADYSRGQDFYRRTGWSPSGEVRDHGRQVAFRRPLS